MMRPLSGFRNPFNKRPHNNTRVSYLAVLSDTARSVKQQPHNSGQRSNANQNETRHLRSVLTCSTRVQFLLWQQASAALPRSFHHFQPYALRPEPWQRLTQREHKSIFRTITLQCSETRGTGDVPPWFLPTARGVQSVWRSVERAPLALTKRRKPKPRELKVDSASSQRETCGEKPEIIPLNRLNRRVPQDTLSHSQGTQKLTCSGLPNSVYNMSLCLSGSPFRVEAQREAITGILT